MPQNLSFLFSKNVLLNGGRSSFIIKKIPSSKPITHEDCPTLSNFSLGEYVGFVFQFYNLIPSLTAKENVALVTEIAPHPMHPREALGLVGLDDRLDRFPAQLSGGEQQRVAILGRSPNVPKYCYVTNLRGALDFRTGKRVLEAIERVNKELGTTTAIITHNAGIAAMADKVITMRSGEITDIKRNLVKVTPDRLEW